ncbi:hypothetical protein Poly41_10540 [Novipirellula artificiosorum]|uniref:Uncharacterized protein n=1 Tax=Novipirellula artificiosorum TaxID=2528016 RepID=A0A5C6E2M6_9BACT|nr:hypothetical protein Poly41_10540 [Novipirellula artificiosorum]
MAKNTFDRSHLHKSRYRRFRIGESPTPSALLDIHEPQNQRGPRTITLEDQTQLGLRSAKQRLDHGAVTDQRDRAAGAGFVLHRWVDPEIMVKAGGNVVG